MSCTLRASRAISYLCLITLLFFTQAAFAARNFSISVTPTQITVAPGNQGEATVQTTGSGGFNASITLSSSGAPRHTSVSFSPNPIPSPGTGSSTVTLAVGSNTTPGTYPITITGQSGSLRQSTTLTLVVSSNANFTISASPASLGLAQGNHGTSTITTAVSGGFNNSISLSASGQPSGASVSFSPNPISAPGSGNSTMTITVGSSTPTGTYPITVTGNGGGIQQTTTVNLTVTATANFTLAASPTSLTVQQGNQGSSTATTSISGSFNSSISLSASGQPTGTTVSFSPNPIPAPGSGSSTMTINVGSSTPTGTYPITVTGNGGGIQQTATVTLTVTAPPNFTLSASPASLTIQQSNQGTSTLTTAISGGFNSSISLSASGQPSGTTVTFSTNPIPAPGSGSSSMTITVGSSTPTGTYPITVTGNGGGIQQTTTVNLTVTVAANFTLSASPASLTIQQSNQGTSTLTTAISGGFNSAISLASSGQPSGTTVTFSTNPIPAPGSGSSTMTINVGSSTPTGTYPITITANGGGIQQTATVTLTVTSGTGSFTLHASSLSLKIGQGNQGSSTITTSVTNGFNNPITLSATALPAGVSITFATNPIPAPGSGNSSMSISVGNTTTPGNYPITVSGNGGGIQQNTVMVLVVQSNSNFTMNASPSSLTVAQGNAGNSTLTTAIIGSFNSSITLTASGQPTGATVAFSTNPIPAPGNGTSTMTISLASSTVTGTYPITVNANGGGVQQNASVLLTVTPTQPASFAIGASPIALSMPQGNQGTTALTTTLSGGFNNSVSLATAALPNGVSVSFDTNPIPAPGNGTANMTINVASGTLSGSYPVTVIATGGGIQRTATMALTVTTTDTAGAPFPTPPQAYVDTTWNPPSNGATWNIGCTGNPTNDGVTLQNTINSAHPGDVIILQSGCTYSGSINLPPKDPTSGLWIYIQSSGLGSLPVPGTRVSPAYQPFMATIATPNTAPTILAQCSGGGYCTGGNNPYGANHYRLVGLELTSNSNYGCEPGNNPPNACWTYYIFEAQSPDNGSTSYLSDSITLDRCYIHGITNGANSQDVSHGIGANATNFAVVDSYISDIHITGTEAQGILAYYTPGPIKIVDNYISSSTQEIMLGGAGGVNNPYVASDVEIRNNTLYKPLTWDSCGTGGTLPPGAILPDGSRCPSGNGAPLNQWIEKNNLELKSAQRVAITGNTMSNTWVSGQTGSSVLFTVRTSQSGNNAVVDDILFEGNVLQNVDSGINTLEQDDTCPGTPGCTNLGETRRIWVDDNLFLVSTNQDNYQHTGLFLDGGSLSPSYAGLADFLFQHNTVLMQDQSEIWVSLYFKLQAGSGCPPPASSTTNVWLVDNALTRQPTGDCGYQGSTGLNYYMGDPSDTLPQRFYGNVMFVPTGDTIQSWPGSSNDATTTPFTYGNPGGGDYQLVIPNWTTTTDSNISGSNWNALEQLQ